MLDTFTQHPPKPTAAPAAKPTQPEKPAPVAKDGYRVLPGAYKIPAAGLRRESTHDLFQCNDCQHAVLDENDMIAHIRANEHWKYPWPEGFDHDHQNDGSYIPPE